MYLRHGQVISSMLRASEGNNESDYSKHYGGRAHDNCCNFGLAQVLRSMVVIVVAVRAVSLVDEKHIPSECWTRKFINRNQPINVIISLWSSV